MDRALKLHKYYKVQPTVIDMKFLAVLLLVAVSVCVLSGVHSTRIGPRCPTACTRIYKPVCGVWKRRGVMSKCNFSNACMMRNERCLRNQNWQVEGVGECQKITADCGILLQPRSG